MKRSLPPTKDEKKKPSHIVDEKSDGTKIWNEARLLSIKKNWVKMFAKSSTKCASKLCSRKHRCDRYWKKRGSIEMRWDANIEKSLILVVMYIHEFNEQLIFDAIFIFFRFVLVVVVVAVAAAVVIVEVKLFAFCMWLILTLVETGASCHHTSSDAHQI